MEHQTAFDLKHWKRSIHYLLHTWFYTSKIQTGFDITTF
jgi:hypothetical protein